MPIDTPYNQEIAKQYNAINRRRADYLQVHMSKMGGGELINTASVSGGGSTGRMIGSGVGSYKKQSSSDCPKGHSVCSCRGGNNAGLEPQTRMELNLGAGKLQPNRNAGNYGWGKSRGVTGAGLSDLYEKGKKVVHKVKKIAHKAKEGYDHLKKAYDVGQDIYKEVKGGKRGGARAEIVKKVMREKGMKMIEASKYVKANNLY
jgi:hypothetical protein